MTGRSIICFGGEDWWYHHPHANNHLMKRFARQNKVMFVNSISQGLPGVASADFFLKIRRKLRSLAKFVRRTDDGLIVVTPVVLPFYRRAWVRALNGILLAAQIRMLMRWFGLSRPVLWIAIPTARAVVGKLGERAVIYNVSDKYDANTYDYSGTAGHITKLHREMEELANVIYYWGKKLLSESPFPEKALLLEQAVDFDHFASASSRQWAEPESLRTIARPRLGYFGGADFVIDQELVKYISARRPEWQWVFAGLKAKRLEIEELPNVHFLGPRPYAELPQYAAHFDVCVLPWVAENEVVKYGSATKVREYLATGKPTVIVPMYEFESYRDVLPTARGYDQFIAHIERAISSDSAEARAARQAAVRNSTWDARAREVAAAIESLIGHKELPGHKAAGVMREA